MPRTSATHTPWDRNYPNDGRGLFITPQIDSAALWFRRLYSTSQSLPWYPSQQILSAPNAPAGEPGEHPGDQ